MSNMDHDSEQGALLQKLSTAFEPYLLSPHDSERVRRLLRGYLATRIKEIEDNQQPETASKRVEQNQKLQVDGLRAEYLKAVQGNITARRQRAVITSQIDAQTPNLDTFTGKQQGRGGLLERHVELLRLQKQNARLVMMKDELDAVQQSPSLANLDIGPNATGPISGRSASENEIESLVDSVNHCVKALEMAVIQARSQSVHQRGLLEGARSQSQSRPEATCRQRLQGMLAVRRELTAWLEDSLEKCQGENGMLEKEINEDERAGTIESEQKIDAQYEQYLDTRRRLLAAVAALRSPLPEKDPQEPSDAESGSQPASRAPCFEASHLNTIQKALLPVLQQQNVSQTHLTFAEEQLEDEISTTINTLDRLSDESQLLQAFPILARSGRFQHAAAAFGKQPDPEDGTGDDISKRIGPWLFAAEAADVASTGTIQSQLSQGEDAIESASRMLAELKLLKQANAWLTPTR